MAQSDRITGKNLYVAWIDGSGTITCSGDYTAFDPNPEMKLVELTAGADAMAYYATTYKDWSGKLEVFDKGTAGTALMNRLAEGNSGTLIWGPLGSATGKPKWGIPAVVNKQTPSYKFDDGVKVTIEFKPQGDFAYDGRSATF